MCFPRELSNEELNAIICGEQDKPPKGMILYLFPDNDSGLVVASNSRELLREKGEEWIDILWATGYQIIPLDFELEGAYFI